MNILGKSFYSLFRLSLINKASFQFYYGFSSQKSFQTEIGKNVGLI